MGDGVVAYATFFKIIIDSILGIAFYKTALNNFDRKTGLVIFIKICNLLSKRKNLKFA